MKRMKQSLILFAALLLTSFVFTSSTLVEDPAIMVIANEKGAPATMTMKELKSVLEGDKQRWSDGTKISIAFMKTSTPVGNATASKVMNMTGDQLNKFWLALVFQGKAKAPLFFNTAAELETYVSQNPGAIGVVDSGYQAKQTKVVSIDGKKSF